MDSLRTLSSDDISITGESFVLTAVDIVLTYLIVILSIAINGEI